VHGALARASYNQKMSEIASTDTEPPQQRTIQSVRLAGFSSRDRELLRLFLRRPPGAGVSLTVVDDDGDLLIANALLPDGATALSGWSGPCPAIGIVERFESDAPFYQVAQDGQMLFSLAQAINRIRSGWMPPGPTSASVGAVGAANEVESDVAGVATVDDPDATSDAPAPASANSTPEPAPPAKPANADSAALAAITASAGLPWQRALNVLVIDDSHFSREAISAALVKVGFAVDTADGGETGLRKAADKVYDVALVDFEMPGMRGPEVLRKLRALGAQCPSVLIMLTSRTGAVDRLRAKFAGCDAYLTKPTRMQEFLNTLREFAIAGKLSRP